MIVIIIFASLIVSFSNITVVETVFFTNSKDNDLPRFGKRHLPSLLYGLKLKDENEYNLPFTNEYMNGETPSNDKIENMYDQSNGKIIFLCFRISCYKIFYALQRYHSVFVINIYLKKT
jgi:hypothetical protein